MEENDPNRLREIETKRLVEMADLAYKNAKDPELPMRMCEKWHSRYTNTVLALNQLLKDSQYREYEQRMREIEEYEKEDGEEK